MLVYFLNLTNNAQSLNSYSPSNHSALLSTVFIAFNLD